MTTTSVCCERPDATELVALLSEQRDLYVRLGQLALGQRELITGDSPERLLGVLGERQRLIDRLEALNSRIRPYQANWRSVRAAMAPADGRRVDGLLAEVNTLLRGIIEKDAADAELLAARKSETARDMQAMKAARTAGAAYGGAAPVSGSQIDWTDE